MRTSVLDGHDDNATRCSLGTDLSSETTRVPEPISTGPRGAD